MRIFSGEGLERGHKFHAETRK